MSNNKIVVLFVDAKHQIYNVKNGYTWQLKGKDNTVRLHSNTGRRRLNILGALNPLSLEITTVITEDNCNTELMMLFVEEIKKKYHYCDKIYLVLDNASYNHSYIIQEFSDDLGIELIYLPPYSPNLNLIERFWKFFISKVIKNRYYKVFDDFFYEILNFLANTNDYVEDLKRLITMNFEIIKET